MMTCFYSSIISLHYTALASVCGATLVFETSIEIAHSVMQLKRAPTERLFKSSVRSQYVQCL